MLEKTVAYRLWFLPIGLLIEQTAAPLGGAAVEALRNLLRQR